MGTFAKAAASIALTCVSTAILWVFWLTVLEIPICWFLVAFLYRQHFSGCDPDHVGILSVLPSLILTILSGFVLHRLMNKRSLVRRLLEALALFFGTLAVRYISQFLEA